MDDFYPSRTAYSRARASLPPLAECWRQFAEVVASVGGDRAYIMGNGVACNALFANGYHDVVHALTLHFRGFHEDERWYRPATAGATFAMQSLNLENNVRRHHDAANNLRGVMMLDALDEDLADLARSIQADGVENHDWDWIARSVLCRWVRMYLAAKTIQRSWKEHMSRVRTQRRCRHIQEDLMKTAWSPERIFGSGKESMIDD
jgi:hypothetical protein